MKKDYASLIRYLRCKENISQELLSKKLGISKSNLSRIENKAQSLIVDDLENAVNYMGSKIIIVNKEGEDVMKKMENEILKNELVLEEVGYSKDFTDINGEKIMVLFNTIDCIVMLPKDMKTKDEYISTNKYNYYQENFNGDDGYGEFYQEYVLESYLWDTIIEMDIDIVKKQFTVKTNDMINNIFDKKTTKEIEELFVKLVK